MTGFNGVWNQTSRPALPVDLMVKDCPLLVELFQREHWQPQTQNIRSEITQSKEQGLEDATQMSAS